MLSDHESTEVQYTIASHSSYPKSAYFTLTQFANKLSQDLDRLNNDASISLCLQPGNHTLDKEIFVTHIKKFSMKRCKSSSTNVTVFVKCISGRLDFSNVSHVQIDGVHFIGCRSTTVRRVEQLILNASSFYSFIGRALVLSHVSAAEIVNCSFQYNWFLERDNIARISLKSEYARSRLPYYYATDIIPLLSSGAFYTEYSNISISGSYFTHNSANFGGALLSAESNIRISTSLFNYNHGHYGGVFATLLTELVIEQSDFNKNTAYFAGGAILSVQDSYNINCSNFVGNTDGVMESRGSTLVIIDSLFSENRAESNSGVMLMLAKSIFYVTGSNFSHNSATGLNVAAVQMYESSELYVDDCIFVHNTANELDSCLYCDAGYVNIKNSRFEYNDAIGYRTMTANECFVNVTGTSFRHNRGSLHFSNSYVVFRGDTVIQNCSSRSSRTHRNETTIVDFEGGAITIVNAVIEFYGRISLLANTAESGGAMLSINSNIMVNGEMTIVNNTATVGNGGGVLMQKSILYVNEKLHLTFNHAAKDGGGIYLCDSKININTYYRSGTQCVLSSNRAERGGGMYFKVNSRLNLNYHSSEQFLTTNTTLFLTDNSAIYGGAVFVDDVTNSYYTCQLNNECFIHVLSPDYVIYGLISEVLAIFKGNIATPMKQGADIFGGFIDKCTLMPLLTAQVLGLDKVDWIYEYITGVKSIAEFSMDYVSSHPVRLRFCNNDGTTRKVDCSYQPPAIFVKKGERFTVSVVALDQVNHFVDANVHVSPASLEAGMAEGQQTQLVRRNCTELEFNVFSPHDHEKISLHADGSCTDSILHLHVQFKNCTCPIGLQPCQSKPTVCECFCDPKLTPYVTSCNETTGSILLKEQSKAWIMYYNDEVQASGYVIHSHCPLDYCLPPAKRVAMNFNEPGQNSQCAYNRTGILCGACSGNLSLSLGSSTCLQCEDYWPAVFSSHLYSHAFWDLFGYIYTASQHNSVSGTHKQFYFLCQHRLLESDTLLPFVTVQFSKRICGLAQLGYRS